MGSSDVGGLWCPECGAQYRPGFTECNDCRVPLSAERPPPRARRRVEQGDHEQLTYDLSEWTEDQRGALDLMLGGAEIPYGWDGSRLLVPHLREADVDDLIEVIEQGEVVEDVAELAVEAGSHEDADQPDLASAGRRLLGYVVDGIVLTALSLFVGDAVLHLDSSSPIALRLVLHSSLATRS